MPFRLTEIVATFLYSGYLPLCPGSWASISTALLLFYWGGHYQPTPLFIILITLSLISLGIPAATLYDRAKDSSDSSCIVIDEVAGMTIALLPLLLLGQYSWVWFIIALLLFRLFDIAKPAGINALQKLPRGWGVMADDLLAGGYSALIIWGAYNLWTTL